MYFIEVNIAHTFCILFVYTRKSLGYTDFQSKFLTRYYQFSKVLQSHLASIALKKKKLHLASLKVEIAVPYYQGDLKIISRTVNTKYI